MRETTSKGDRETTGERDNDECVRKITSDNENE